MISFYYEEVEPPGWDEAKLQTWLQALMTRHGWTLTELNCIYVDDETLRTMNEEHLQHEDYTDILTFDWSNPNEQTIHGDLFMSIDRIRDNAQEWNTTFEEEARRVLAHGTLHLIGFNDLTDEEEAEMRSQEDQALSLWNNLPATIPA